VRIIGYRHQRTLGSEAIVEGAGLVSGARVRVRLSPAPADTGLVFRRTDRPAAPPVPALAANVTDTRRRTTLGPAAHGVTLVEHLLAALAGLRIDNCEIELDGPEPPGLDGSAAAFVAAVRRAGDTLQYARRPIWAVTAPVVLTAGGATIALHPATRPGLRASYLLDYGPFGPINRQVFTLDVVPGEFAREAAPGRTFVTEAEVAELRAQGVGRHLTAADLVVFGPHGPIGNRLRFADEPARHKVLDLIGDLALCGFDLAGHVVAYRSGHALNVELARNLAALAAAAGPSKRQVVGSSSHPGSLRVA
jgi:UDP-3-O-acyl N-acetylglucosamine deacetylase